MECSGKSVEAAVLEGTVLPPPPPPGRIKLHDAEAIRREMNRVYRDARGGVIKVGDATRFVYILDLIRRAYETSELERRLQQLEERKDLR